MKTTVLALIAAAVLITGCSSFDHMESVAMAFQESDNLNSRHRIECQTTSCSFLDNGHEQYSLDLVDLKVVLSRTKSRKIVSSTPISQIPLFLGQYPRHVTVFGKNIFLYEKGAGFRFSVRGKKTWSPEEKPFELVPK